MSLDLGDSAFGRAITIQYESNGSGSAGDAVTINSSDQVAPTSSAGEDVFGVLAEDSPSSGDDVTVVVHGDVIANAGGSVVASNVVVSSTTSGQLAQNADATGRSVDVDGTTDQGVFAPANPYALTDSGGTLPDGNSLGTNEALIWVV